VFWSGRSQAVRLPKEFRVVGPTVVIHREGRRIVLEEPRVTRDAQGWPTGFWQSLGVLDSNFDLGDRAPAHERPDPFGTSV
jgi:antitoxin VapB